MANTYNTMGVEIHTVSSELELAKSQSAPFLVRDIHAPLSEHETPTPTRRRRTSSPRGLDGAKMGKLVELDAQLNEAMARPKTDQGPRCDRALEPCASKRSLPQDRGIIDTGTTVLHVKNETSASSDNNTTADAPDPGIGAFDDMVHASIRYAVEQRRKCHHESGNELQQRKLHAPPNEPEPVLFPLNASSVSETFAQDEPSQFQTKQLRDLKASSYILFDSICGETATKHTSEPCGEPGRESSTGFRNHREPSSELLIQWKTQRGTCPISP